MDYSKLIIRSSIVAESVKQQFFNSVDDPRNVNYYSLLQNMASMGKKYLVSIVKCKQLELHSDHQSNFNHCRVFSVSCSIQFQKINCNVLSLMILITCSTEMHDYLIQWNDQAWENVFSEDASITTYNIPD